MEDVSLKSAETTYLEGDECKDVSQKKLPLHHVRLPFNSR